MKSLKAAIVFGARPQFIKAAALSWAYSEFFRKQLSLVWIHSGQHYDYRLSEAFFKEFSLPDPDYHLNVGSGPQGKQTALILERVETCLIKEKPDAVVVFGDTNTTLGGALAASKLGIPVAHVEAGLRSFNRRMPEETNRIVSDTLSSILFCSSKLSVEQLGRESQTGEVHQTGDVMVDVLKRALRTIKQKACEAPYYLATIHRNYNTDDPVRLRAIFRLLGRMENRVIMPIHPRTKKILESNTALYKYVKQASNICLTEPVSYQQMILLEMDAKGILTDSGGIQKEAFLLGVPCVTLRNETEWTETVVGGKNVLCQPNAKEVSNAFLKMRLKKQPRNSGVYGDGHAGRRILKILIDYLKSHRRVK